MAKKNECNDDNIKRVIDYYENIIAKMPGHVFWKDRNAILQGCNDQQAKTIGLKSRHDVVGMTNYDMVIQNQPEEEKQRQAEEITKIDMEIMESGKAKVVEEPLVLPDGSTRTFLSNKSPIFDEEGRVVGLLGMAFDITAEKEAERLEIEKQNAEFFAKEMQLLASSVAHELRTPLASIRLANGILKDFIDQVESYNNGVSQNDIYQAKKSQENIKAEVDYAVTFINMLSFNLKPISQETYNEIFSIKHCVIQAIERYPFQPDERELVIFETEMDDFQVRGKEILIIHVLFNLLKNALYYIQKSDKGSISIKFNAKNEVNELIFKDTGTGIKSEEVDKIFIKFYSNTPHGSGVGLTFCKEVMKALGGDIKCNSKYGKYTEFVLRFPKYEKLEGIQ